MPAPEFNFAPAFRVCRKEGTLRRTFARWRSRKMRTSQEATTILRNLQLKAPPGIPKNDEHFHNNSSNPPPLNSVDSVYVIQLLLFHSHLISVMLWTSIPTSIKVNLYILSIRSGMTTRETDSRFRAATHGVKNHINWKELSRYTGKRITYFTFRNTARRTFPVYGPAWYF